MMKNKVPCLLETTHDNYNYFYYRELNIGFQNLSANVGSLHFVVNILVFSVVVFSKWGILFLLRPSFLQDPCLLSAPPLNILIHSFKNNYWVTSMCWILY